jgi:hypothetical protein
MSGALLAVSGGLLSTSAFASPSVSIRCARGTSRTPIAYYSTGRRADGVPIAAISSLCEPDHTRRLTAIPNFIYAPCDFITGAGCDSPLEIQNWPACRRNPTSYGKASDPPGPVVAQPTTIRGVPAAYFPSDPRLELYTGRTTIVIFARDHDQLLRLATELRRGPGSLHGPRRPSEPLPAPSRAALKGKLSCRRRENSK